MMNAIITQTASSTLSTIKGGIPVRRETFDASGSIPRYFVKNNPLLTHLFIALSTTFPTGERFFVHSVRAVRDRVQDDELQARISGFIGQEAMHSHAHEDFNDFAKSLGVDIAPILKEEEQSINFAKANLNEAQQLAATCALEHFTAIFAKYFLDTAHFYDDMHPKVARLWFWHAIEETEHKAVAFDVYKAVFDDEKVRKRVMRVVTVSFLSRIAALTMRLLAKDKVGRLQFKKHLDGLDELRRIAMYLKDLYLDYYREDFHPNDDDTSELLNTWYDKLGFVVA